MLIPKKLNAFTLSEMVVVLIITGIVVGLGFSVLNLVQKNMQRIQRNFNERTELNALEESFWLDFNRYPQVEFDSLKDELRLKNALDSTTYRFNADKVIKGVDTFKIGGYKKHFMFNGDNVDNGKVDAIKLVITKAQQKNMRFVFKINSASHFMNHGI